MHQNQRPSMSCTSPCASPPLVSAAIALPAPVIRSFSSPAELMLSCDEYQYGVTVLLLTLSPEMIAYTASVASIALPHTDARTPRERADVTAHFTVLHCSYCSFLTLLLKPQPTQKKKCPIVLNMCPKSCIDLWSFKCSCINPFRPT